ncbi:MAG: RsiV family protein [Dysgonomonas sp.]
MKTIFMRFSLIILVFAMLFSCETKKKSDTPNDIVYDSVSVAKIYHLENDSTKPSCSLKINYIFPVKYSNQNVLSKMQSELNFAFMEDEKYEKFSPKDAVDKYIEDYIENYKQDASEQFPDWAESDDPEDYFSYYKTLSTKVLFDKGGLVSYQITSMDYKGGANSSTSYRNAVINLSTGESIYEKDIYVTDYKEVLNPLLIKKIVEQNKVQTPEDLLMYGYWGIEDLTSSNNFSVDDKGITYIFNPGEYSAPTLGEIRVFLPYSEIKIILKEGSPISGLVGI